MNNHGSFFYALQLSGRELCKSVIVLSRRCSMIVRLLKSKGRGTGLESKEIRHVCMTNA